MLRENELIPLHAEPNHPQQAYKTNPDWKKHFLLRNFYLQVEPGRWFSHGHEYLLVVAA